MPPTDAAEAWARRNARVDELAGGFLRDLAAIDEYAIEAGISDALGLALDQRVIPEGDWDHLDGLLRVIFEVQRDRLLLGFNTATTSGELDPRAVPGTPVVRMVLVNLRDGIVPLARALRVLAGEEPASPTRPVLRGVQGGAE